MQYLSLSDLFHLALYSLGPFMLLEMAKFLSFLWLNYMYVAEHTSLSIRLLMGI